MKFLLSDPVVQNVICMLFGICVGVISGFLARKRMYYRERFFHIKYIQHLERKLGIPQDLRRYNFYAWDNPKYYEDEEYIITLKEDVQNDE